MVSSALLWSLLAVSLSGILAQDSNKKMYKANAPQGGRLFGAMVRLRNSNPDFTFTTSTDKDYGEILGSVNGLSWSIQDHTYWELLVQKADNAILRSDVGIGCYIPQANETVILSYKL